MVETEKEHGFTGMMIEGISYVTKIITAGIFSPVAEGAEMIMKNIERRIIQMERRMLRKISSLFLIGLGGVLLTLALLFFLKEFMGWSNATALFSVGIIIFLTGFLLKIAGSDN